MTKTCELQQLAHLKYSVVVWSVSYVNPIESLAEIGEELSNRQYRGRVIFDLLLANGIEPNRFVEAYFDGTRFDVRTFNVVSKGLESIKEVALSFYRNHSGYVERSVLTTPVRFRIRRNVAV